MIGWERKSNSMELYKPLFKLLYIIQEGLVRQLSARDQELLDSSKEAVGVAKDLLGVNKEVLLTNQQMMEVLKEVKSDVQEVNR